ncbi:hypothetical protein LPJ77_001150 [Coemansia sp. RSA 2523]|nr:hypothetical protein LPJ58_003809 [Coemansia sp. RSA 1591]KAJ1779415.1 hypothetical protein LPJ54_000945 [Coemansia sp. RSA 1824]KAJ1785548.1 hypothetical protein LPJ62_004185 [Coemansia sp. RSA 2167]KAJ1810119.1 hypothetical protein LPJ77_001150 [Coemansia sp. RSA 2523]KAJ2149249.1 hypothetical protein IW142_000269 [Coemansia sp. RSA 564]KAJ2153197.1 hypothetical protein J3F82_002151 [Coemansia sp. RSA 637]KAJ2168878.1 hypothetical protein GGH15_001012 [Coemansia sp. RSA 562]KAJ2172098.1
MRVLFQSALFGRLAGTRLLSTTHDSLTKSVLAAAISSKLPTKAQVPQPRGKFTSPSVFLQTIGRGCDKFSPKFKSWDQLFSASGEVMKHELGIGPKPRKWILMWTNKFRLGIDPYFIPTSKKHEIKRVDRLARMKRRGRT